MGGPAAGAEPRAQGDSDRPAHSMHRGERRERPGHLESLGVPLERAGPVIVVVDPGGNTVELREGGHAARSGGCPIDVAPRRAATAPILRIAGAPALAAPSNGRSGGLCGWNHVNRTEMLLMQALARRAWWRFRSTPSGLPLGSSVWASKCPELDF